MELLLPVCCPVWLNPLCQGQFHGLVAMPVPHAVAADQSSAYALQVQPAPSCLMVPHSHVCHVIYSLAPLQSLYMQLDRA